MMILYEKTKIKDNKFIKIIREVVSKILMAGIEMQNEYKAEDLPLTIESEVREKCNNQNWRKRYVGISIN